MAPEGPAAGPFSILLERPAATLAVWALPALAIAALTVLVAPPALSFAEARPTPADTLAALATLAGQLYGELFVLILAAAPTALLVAGKPLPEALAVLRKTGPWGVAALCALLLSFALLLTMAPGLLALYINPLMGLIFLTVGTIGGAALAVGLFGRWMFAPALAAEGRGVLDALNESRVVAKRQRTFGAAFGLAVLFAIALALGAGAGVLGAAALPTHPVAARIVAMAAVLALLLPAAPASCALRLQEARAGLGAASRQPTLALRSRPTKCPSCGALASIPAAGSRRDVTCAGCGLRAVVS